MPGSWLISAGLLGLLLLVALYSGATATIHSYFTIFVSNYNYFILKVLLSRNLVVYWEFYKTIDYAKLELSKSFNVFVSSCSSDTLSMRFMRGFSGGIVYCFCNTFLNNGTLDHLIKNSLY